MINSPIVYVYETISCLAILYFCVIEAKPPAGNSPAGIKGFNFKPVIRAVKASTSATTDDAGYYAMTGISAELYRLSATLAEFDTVTYEGVELVEGNLTVQNFTLTK